MNPDQYAYLQQLFLQLRGMDDTQRQALLEAQPPEVQQDLQSLLAADQSASSFLDKGLGGPRSAADSPTRDLPAEPAPLPRQVGPYRLLQTIGEGGFGTVFLAEQTTPVRRKVAVKLIKPGMGSREILARFDAEQQALAMMNHPSIARVLDAGTAADGAPYFVMELVKGIPVDEFCLQNKSDLGQRLKLFNQICQAVHHAHQKGIIHRDLKPANILVTMGEQEPLAKVIDFGIAKALDSHLTEQTLFTAYGQMIGTLEYMSPEQAEMSAVDIDTRSDIYSLGAVLYHLLTGQPPIGRQLILQSGFHDVPKHLREIEPLTPSSLVTQQQAARVGETATPPPRGLSTLLRSDLDWIVLKALAKDRRARYESALDLSRDLARFEQGLPVEAHPPSWTYRMGKWAKRHRFAVVTATVLVLSTLLGVGGLVAGFLDALDSRRRADASRDQMKLAQLEAASQARELSETVYPELVNSAWQAARQFNPRRARHLLQTTDPGLRGWEWDWAQHWSNLPAAAPIRQTDLSSISAMVTHPVVPSIVCLTEGGAVEIRGADSDQLQHSISGDFQATAVQFSADAQRLLIGTVEGRVRVYRTTNWDHEATHQLMSGAIYDIAVSDSGQLAVSTGGAWIKLYASADFDRTQQWKLPARVSRVKFDDSGQLLLGCGLDGCLYQCRIDVDSPVSTRVSSSSLTAIQSTASGDLLLSDSDTLYLLPRPTDQEASRFPWEAAISRPVFQAPVLSAFQPMPNGYVLLGGGDGRLSILAPDNFRETILAEDLGAAVRGLLTAAQHSSVCVALGDGRILNFMLEKSPEGGWETGDSGWVTVNSPTEFADALLLPANRLAMFLTRQGELQAFDIQSGHQVHSVQAHKGGWAMSVDASENLLATVGDDRRLCCWTLPELERIATFDIGWGVRDVCVGPGGKWVAAAPPADAVERSGAIGLWDPQLGTCQQVLAGHENWVVSLCTSPDGRWLVSAGVNKTCRVWDLADNSCRHTIAPPNESIAEHLATGPHGKWFFAGHQDGRISRWSLLDGQPAGIWQAFGDSLSGMAVTRDMRLLATARSDRRLHVRDVHRNATVANLDLGLGYLQGMRLTAEGTSIGVIGADNRARLGTMRQLSE